MLDEFRKSGTRAPSRPYSEPKSLEGHGIIDKIYISTINFEFYIWVILDYINVEAGAVEDRCGNRFRAARIALEKYPRADGTGFTPTKEHRKGETRKPLN